MEDALQKLMKEAGSTKYTSIATSAHKALDLLESYSRAPPFEYRKNTLEAVRFALDIGNPKIIAQAIVILQKLIRDDRFHSKEAESNEDEWMSSQVLAAVHGTDNLTEDQKQEILKVILTLSCQTYWLLNGHLVVKIFNLCLGLYGTSNTGTKASAQATCSQTISEYMKKLKATNEEAETKYNDILPSFQYLNSRLDAILKDNCDDCGDLNLLIQCLYGMINHAPLDIIENSFFKRYVCTKLSPTVIALLDLADHPIINSNTAHFWSRKSNAIKLGDPQVKVISHVFVDLAILLGPDAEMRPVIESLFHRLLICSQPKYRSIAFNCLKESLRKPKKLLRLALYDHIKEEMDFDSMPLFKLISDSIEQCSRFEDNQKMIQEAADLIHNIFESIHQISEGKEIDPTKTELIMKVYPLLQDSDYNGPNFYDGTSRLPKDYTNNLNRHPSTSSELSQDFKESSIDKTNENDSAKENISSELKDDSNEDKSDASKENEDESLESKEDKSNGLKNQEESSTKDDEIKEKTIDNEEKSATEKAETPSEEKSQDNDKNDSGEDLSDKEKEDVKESKDNDLNKSPKNNGFDSDGNSEDTEGPEEGYDEDPNVFKLDNYVNEAEEIERENAMFTNKKIPRSFNEAQSPIHECYAEGKDDIERENAKTFVNMLKEELEHIVQSRGLVEMDCRLQEFASKFCHQYSTHSSSSKEDDVIILNADGVYMASYYALHLNMFLANKGFYSKSLPITANKQQFLDNILGSGLLIYVSPVWLSEVFDIISEVDVFGFSYKHQELRMNPLKNLLLDLDGFDITQKGSQLLSDTKLYRQGGIMIPTNVQKESELIEVGKRIGRRILTTCWSSFRSYLMAILSPFLNSGRSDVGGIGGLYRTSKLKRKQTFLRISIIQTCLQKGISLCGILELHNHCAELLEPLTNLISPDPFSYPRNKISKVGSRESKYDLGNLINIETILKNGLEIASQSQDCWKYVMRCATYVLHMESESSDKIKPKRKPLSPNPRRSRKNSDDLDLNFDADQDEEDILSCSSFALPSGFNNDAEQKGLGEYFKQHIETTKEKILYLNAEESATANSILLNRIDKLFDDAANKLNLKSLIGFMSELSFCSHKELITTFPRKILSTKIKDQIQVLKQSPAVNGLLLFHRISEVMLKCIKSGRPLLHIVRSWAVVGPHLMEAACHKETSVAKKAVDYIHDIILLFLQNSSELTYFHFNETLFKPFENLICLELCDSDIQDQIVTSICEFVETSTNEIGSGWRSLFGTLREVRFPMNDPNSRCEYHWRAVLDVFEAFLATESPQIFANAALDYISCLIHHVKGSEERQQLEELIPLSEVEFYLTSNGDSELTNKSLQYLIRCNQILKRMYQMTSCPVFQGSHKIHILNTIAVVDPLIPDIELESFNESTDTLPEFPYSFKNLQISDKNPNVLFLEGDKSRGLMRVWYLLVDGLITAVMNCPRDFQSQAVDSVFTILDTLQQSSNEKPLKSFGLFCTNHILLPMMQSWLRRSQRTFQGWLISGPNFKHCMGRTTEFVLGWLNEEEFEKESLFAYKQLLLILIECTVVPVESVARLGCSCFRYIVLNYGAKMKSNHWDIFVLSLCRATQLTLYPLHQLMAPFYSGSSNFYGDFGEVKVAARKDSCKQESHRLMQLGQQVLLLDQQRSELPTFPENPDIEEKSFLFLLQHPSNASNGPIQGIVSSTDKLIRVPMRNMLTGLTSHHILLQIFGNMLLQGTDHVVPSLANLLLHSSVVPPLTPYCESKSLPGSAKLNGVLENLSYDQVNMLLCCLKSSYTTSNEFDSRPGLKFLIQKVAQLNNAANLYKQAGAAWSMIAISLFELCLNKVNVENPSVESIKQALENDQKDKNTHQFTAVQSSKVTKDDEKDTSDILTNSYGFFIDLYNFFMELCEMYVDILVDKEGHHSKIDAMSKQQLYFLTIEPDDFKEYLKKPVFPRAQKSPQLPRKSKSNSICSESSLASANSKRSGETTKSNVGSVTPTKPFQFSDFTSQPVRPESPNVSEYSDVRPPSDPDDNLEKRHSQQLDSLNTTGDQDLPGSVEELNQADEEVFRVATQDEMEGMMSVYRQRKGKRTMPSTSKETPPSSAGISGSGRKNPFLSKPKIDPSIPPDTDPEIVNQQNKSLMADSEAKIAVWTQLVLVFFHLSSSLDDNQFKVFLPLLFPGVRILTAYAKDNELKQNISDFFQKVASIYGFTSEL